MFSCLSCFYLSYTLPICGLFYLVLLASTLSRYSLFCADGTLNPFHSLTHYYSTHLLVRCIFDTILLSQKTEFIWLGFDSQPGQMHLRHHRNRQFIWLGSTRSLVRCTFDTISPSQTVRNLGAYIDSAISFIDHFTSLTRTCFFHICELRSIRRTPDFIIIIIKDLM